MDDRTETAAKACAACRKYKRKCNKALPSCSTCLGLRRECDYSIPSSAQLNPEEEIVLLRARLGELEGLMDKALAGRRDEDALPSSVRADRISSPSNNSLSSSLLFLDQKFFAHLGFSVETACPPMLVDIATAIKDELDQQGAMELLVSRYFDAVHDWMPIISMMRMKRVISRSHKGIRADAAFLLASMKLLLHTPESGTRPEDTPLYRAVKTASLQLELSGLQPFMVVQGGLLIAVYELGHGIHQSAYMTVAHCARQAISLGVHDQEGPKFLQPWAEWEEQIRVWWFVLMLDRYVTVGREGRPLCTEDPKKHTPLPENSEAWDRGAMTSPNRLYVSSSASAIASPYARLAQAFNLLGRVIRHCDDHEQDFDFTLDELNALHQAISALLKLILAEGSNDSYAATAVCFSALMKLHKNHLSDSFGQDYARRSDSQLSSRIRECSETSYNIMIDISLQILSFAQSLEVRILMSGVDKMSPWYSIAFTEEHTGSLTSMGPLEKINSSLDDQFAMEY